MPAGGDAADAADTALTEERFQADMARLDRGEPTELGYVYVERDHHPEALVVFATRRQAAAAIDDEEHLLLTSLAEEDCLDMVLFSAPCPAAVTGVEVIFN